MNRSLHHPLRMVLTAGRDLFHEFTPLRHGGRGCQRTVATLAVPPQLSSPGLNNRLEL